jgi:hypothetical protein
MNDLVETLISGTIVGLAFFLLYVVVKLASEILFRIFSRPSDDRRSA